MPTYHGLKAWQHAQRLAVAGVRAATALPDYEQEALAHELRRACCAVPLNIAEGASRTTEPARGRALDAAWGALAAVQTALGIARELGYIGPTEFARLEALAMETSKTLFGLMRRYGSRRPSPGPDPAA